MRTFILALLIFPGIVAGQVHIKNQKYLQIYAGAYDEFLPSGSSYFAGLELGKYNRKLNSRGFGVMYGRKLSSNNIPVEKFQLSYKQEINVFSSANLTSSFKILGTVNFGYESINRDQKYFNDDFVSTKSAFMLGVGTGAEYEYTPLVIGARTTYNFLSQYQKFSTYPYMGIKIHFW